MSAETNETEPVHFMSSPTVAWCPDARGYFDGTYVPSEVTCAGCLSNALRVIGEAQKALAAKKGRENAD